MSKSLRVGSRITLEQELEIERAASIIRNARDWLDYQKGHGKWKPRTLWQILLERPRPYIPFPPMSPLPGQVSDAEAVLTRYKNAVED